MDQSPVQPGTSDNDDPATDDPWGPLPTIRKLRGGRRDGEPRWLFGRRDGTDRSGVDDDAEDGTAAGRDEGRPAAGSGG
jgi:hypothetical protein